MTTNMSSIHFPSSVVVGDVVFVMLLLESVTVPIMKYESWLLKSWWFCDIIEINSGFDSDLKLFEIMVDIIKDSEEKDSRAAMTNIDIMQREIRNIFRKLDFFREIFWYISSLVEEIAASSLKKTWFSPIVMRWLYGQQWIQYEDFFFSISSCFKRPLRWQLFFGIADSTVSWNRFNNKKPQMSNSQYILCLELLK